MTCRLLNLLTALSLLLCVAVCGLWVRSHRATDRWDGARRGLAYSVISVGGAVVVAAFRGWPEELPMRWHANAPVAAPTRGGYAVRVAMDGSTSFFLDCQYTEGVGSPVSPRPFRDVTVPYRLVSLPYRLALAAVALPSLLAGLSAGMRRVPPGRRPEAWALALALYAAWAAGMVGLMLLAGLCGLGVYSGLLLRRALVRKRRVRSGHCPACGYDLRASPGRCPECGSGRDPA